MSRGSLCAFWKHDDSATTAVSQPAQLLAPVQACAVKHATAASASALHAASRQGLIHCVLHFLHFVFNRSSAPRQASSWPQAQLAAFISTEQGGRPFGSSSRSVSTHTVLRWVARHAV